MLPYFPPVAVVVAAGVAAATRLVAWRRQRWEEEQLDAARAAPSVMQGAVEDWAIRLVSGHTFHPHEGNDVVVERLVDWFAHLPLDEADLAHLALVSSGLERSGGMDAFCVVTAYAAATQALREHGPPRPRPSRARSARPRRRRRRRRRPRSLP